MELNVRNDSKIVEIWLTREEKQDAQLQKKLKLVYQSFNETGYTVATFLSGEQALEEITRSAITANGSPSWRWSRKRNKALQWPCNKALLKWSSYFSCLFRWKSV